MAWFPTTFSGVPSVSAFPRLVQLSCTSEPFSAQVGSTGETQFWITQLHSTPTGKDPWGSDVSGALPRDVHLNVEHNL